MKNESRIASLILAYAHWVVRRGWPVLLSSLLIAAIASLGLFSLEMNDDYRTFFDENDVELVAYTALQDIFTKNEYVVFALAPDGGEVFTPEVLAAIEQLTDEAWKLRHSIRVDSVTNFPHTRAAGDDLVIKPLIEDVANSSLDALARAKRLATSEPRLRHSLISPSGHVAGVTVTYQLPDDARVEGTEAAMDARALAIRFQTEHPDIKIYLTGPLMLNDAFREAAIGDIKLLIPLMYLGITLLMLVMFRSVAGMLATVSVVLLSVCSGLGIAGWLGFDITAPSASSPTIIMTLAIADSVHILMTLLREMRGGRSRHEAIIYSLRTNFIAVALTSLTTAVGFLTLNFSDSPPFRDLGNICAMGATAAFFYSVLFLPALLSVVSIRVNRSEERSEWYMESLAALVLRRRKLLLPGFVLVVILLSALIPLNELNDHYTMYFDESIAFKRDIDFTTENLTGMYQIEYALESGEEYGICEPAYLAKLEAFAEWFRSQPGAVHVDSFSETMKRINMALHGDDPAMYRVPEGRKLAAQYLLLYEMSLPFGLDLNHRINVSRSSTRFIVTMGGISADALSSAAIAGEQWLVQNTPSSMHSLGMGPGVMFSRISRTNIRSMLVGATAALALISLILLLSLRSVKIGLISLVPNLVPAAMAFGVWGLVVGRIGLGLSAVITMTLGIVVDDTVHFLDRYLRARRQNAMSPEDALRYTFRSVGMALFGTSVILVGGFLVLSLSSFKINAAMGQMCAIIIVFALATDFLLLPSLLLVFDKSSRPISSDKEGASND